MQPGGYDTLVVSGLLLEGLGVGVDSGFRLVGSAVLFVEINMMRVAQIKYRWCDRVQYGITALPTAR